jgi:outer membrane receptor for ferrienterochelin and colicin
VLRDGASAIYGTDAIGGVINFVLKRDYQGFEMSAQTQLPQHLRRRQTQRFNAPSAGARWRRTASTSWARSTSATSTCCEASAAQVLEERHHPRRHHRRHRGTSFPAT